MSDPSSGAAVKPRAEITRILLKKTDARGVVEIVLITPHGKQVIYERHDERRRDGDR